jgi:iron complex outermembrane receptor protein
MPSRVLVGVPGNTPREAEGMKSNKTIKGWHAGSCLCLYAVVSTTFADTGAVIEEIIVTAQKRESNVQTTPLAISAFAEEQLDNRGIDNAGDLQLYVPGLTFGKTVTRTSQVTLRGIGAENINPGGDPGVAVHVNGAYQQSTAFIAQDFFDVERIEVLRGPQGTLYGRNATGGSINIITNKPTAELEGKLVVGLGDYDQRKVQGFVSGPLWDRTRGRLSISSEKHDGYTRNVYNGKDIDDKDYYAVRGQLAWDPTDDLSVNLTVHSYRDDSSGVPLTLVGENPTGPLFAGLDLTTFAPIFWNPYVELGALPNVTLQDRRKVKHNTATTGKEDSDGAIAELVYNFGAVTLKSTTGFTDMDYRNAGDTDSAAEVSIAQFLGGSYRTLTQELLLTSSNASDWEWTLGLYYYKEDSDFYFGLVMEDSIPLPTPYVGVPVTYDAGGDVEADSYAVFGQSTYALSDRISLTAGIRYTRDRKDMTEYILAPAFAFVDFATGDPVTDSKNETWSKTTGRLGVDYTPTADTLIYASISTGFKAGGFNVSGMQPSYDPELVTAYEAGLKTRFFEGRVQMNLAAFFYDYEDLQVFQIESVTPVINNAAKAEVFGIEAEFVALVSDNLNVDASFSYLDATYEEFFSVDAVDPAAGLQDLSGNNLPRSPELSLNLGVNYTWRLDSHGSLKARLSYSWMDEQYFRAFNLKRDRQGAYSRTDLNLTWRSPTEQWEVRGFVRNIEDDDIISNIIVAAGTLGSTPLASFNPPRTYGVTISRHW